jgi:hypothetical protein
MADPMDLEKVISGAPVGVVMHGTMTLHKAPNGQLVMVMEVGPETHKMVIAPAFIKAMSGKGPLGKVLGRFLGNGGNVPELRSDES